MDQMEGFASGSCDIEQMYGGIKLGVCDLLKSLKSICNSELARLKHICAHSAL